MLLLTPLLVVAVTGCSSSDDRLARFAAESNRQQVEQNQEMARVHREVAQGTTRLVDAVAESRREMLGMERELQDQRTELDAERKSIADQRHRESLLAPVVANVGLLLVAALPLVLCWYLLHGLRSDGEEVGEVLVESLVEQRLGVIASTSTRPGIEHAEPGSDDSEPEPPPF